MKFYKFLGICLILCLISLSAVYADDEVINSSDSSIEDSNFDVIDEEDYSSSFDSSNDVIDKNVSEKIYFFDENNESIGYIVFYNDNLSLPDILVNGVKSSQDTIVANDLTKYYGASDRLVATFYNADGSLLKNSNVSITIHGQTYIKLTNDMGVIISLNTYVSNINYSYYINHNQSAIETICNFSGNCVDQTNVFISLARIKNIPVAYISGSPINGTDGHMWAQVIVDNIWVTIDNSATGYNYSYHDNSYLGDKDYLTENLNIDYYIFNYYSNNYLVVFHDNGEYIFY